VEFEKQWKGLKGDARRQSACLRLILPAQLPALLKQALTPGLLAALLSTLLRTTVDEDPAAAVAALEALPGVPRFDMNLMSLTTRERAAAAAAWDTAAECLGGGSPLGARLAVVRQRFKL
jgi:hypothetical protein